MPTAKTVPYENDIGLIVAEGWEQLGIKIVIYTPPGAELKLRRDLGEFTIHLHGEGEMDLFDVGRLPWVRNRGGESKRTK